VIRGGFIGRAPFDVWLCVLLVGGAGVVFLAESLIRFLSEGGGGILALPVALLVLEGGAAVAIFAGTRWTRPVVLIVVILGALSHMVIALGQGVMWTRVVSAVLAIAQVYALVALNTKPIREHFGISQ
jgi:hypothetical protein